VSPIPISTARCIISSLRILTPLQNWSSLEKYSTLGTVCFYSFIATVNASNFGVAIIPLSVYFKTSTARIAYLVCFNTLMSGFGNLFWVPLMRVIGKRPVFLMGMTLLAVFNAWSFNATTFGSLLAARMFSGFAAAAGDATVPAVVADIFFVHERGFVMMIFHVAFSCGFFIGPLINGYVVQETDGWKWTCGWIAIASGVNLLVALFTVRETAYYNRDVNAPVESFGPKRGFLSYMSVTRGYNRYASFFTSLYNIVSIGLYPPVVWAAITVGVFGGW
jgi:MFS family permease